MKKTTTIDDVNARVGALLRDLATIQPTRERGWGYKRAASTVLGLEEPLDTLTGPDGTLPKIPNIGPSSTRVIAEVLATGTSETAERAIAESPKAQDVVKARALRQEFFSRARVLAILGNARLRAVGRDDYRGDVQMHSQYSDGRESIAALAQGCIDRGYEYCAITDHSRGLPIAGGLSADEITRQHREIDDVNTRMGGRFRVLKGIEANIAADGTLDLEADERRAFDLVLAAPHSKLRLTDDQTTRLLAAVSEPNVHILAHPRGRMYGTRAGILADWDRVFRAAAAHDVAVEIDGDPSRQDLDHTLARRALRAGCVFALDSDAHATDELPYADIALAHARLAGIPAGKVINTWPLARLLAWAGR